VGQGINDEECFTRTQLLDTFLCDGKHKTKSSPKSCRAQGTLQGDSLVAERRKLTQSVPQLRLNRSTGMSESQEIFDYARVAN